MSLTLYYFHDPMCSWCWAFRPRWQEIVEGLPDLVRSQRVLGGLAPDTEQAMPTDMQAKLKGIWQKIQQTVPGTPFNFEFWERCVPRRSTYAACRAVIAARRQNPGYEENMILAIQQAYYLEARNPADRNTLIELANEIGLDRALFSADMESPAVHEALLKEIEFTHRLEVKGFPTLLLEKEGVFTGIQHEYNDVKAVLHQIKRLS
ncbi:DsbA family protein [Methylomicrobium lacus]|uniref:DsbA family protein n=1 Tax=Methylomicrobium lacus TaxID=136992 RepID=UPI00045E828C|nr:DsbA family protein [Methylomicrobium lacus]